mmetsp:Transcript_8183/g.17747  ORF Transcript_8183/g.17747 Transcript_8183/m.17747 type:complete len:614 (+) Transcript_8183:76-1917(+)
MKYHSPQPATTAMNSHSSNMTNANIPRSLQTSQRRKTISKRRRPSSQLPPKAAVFVLLATTSRILTPQHVSAQYACNHCENIDNGFVQIPGTNCAEFVQCASNVISQKFSCQGGLIFDKNLSQCNWATSATCGPDPVCPSAKPTRRPVPVAAPDIIEAPTPLTAEEPSAPTSTSTQGTFPPTEEGYGLVQPKPPSAPTTVLTSSMATTLPAAATSSPMMDASGSGLQPRREEHHAAVWAHLNANKIGISNQLLRSAHRTLRSLHGNNLDAGELRNYAYYDFYGALRSMVEEGYAVPMMAGGGEQFADADAPGRQQRQPLVARNVFYLGDLAGEDAAAVGLINVATFLSQAMAESIAAGSCDEINEDVVDGSLPASNSCGQFGRSYQDMTCSDDEKFMECDVYSDMEMGANPNGRPVAPFFCASTERFPFTGSADYIAGRAPVDAPVPNQNGRTDVEGCCWWGRGTISTRGVCQYGKLNYYLGARAAEEGRPARYPNIDFCVSPQAICSPQRQDSSIEWVSGLFRWIDDVQSYVSYNGDGGVEWSYVQKLHEFVAGGMTDGLFIHSVSSIVTQGCYNAPCPGYRGEQMTDAGVRWSYFLQVLEALGLPVKALQS